MLPGSYFAIISDMEIKVKEKLHKDIKNTSELLGIKEQELIDRALFLYLESVKGILELEREFKAWNELSDEALINMSARLKAGL